MPAPPAEPPAAFQVAQIVTAPDWRRRASSRDVLRAYPPEALAKRVPGDVDLSCEIMVTGDLGACTVVRERPHGLGFGAAALGLTRRYNVRPQALRGAIGTTIYFDIRFEPPK